MQPVLLGLFGLQTHPLGTAVSLIRPLNDTYQTGGQAGLRNRGESREARICIALEKHGIGPGSRIWTSLLTK